jgi:hypothetical protein
MVEFRTQLGSQATDLGSVDTANRRNGALKWADDERCLSSLGPLDNALRAP